VDAVIFVTSLNDYDLLMSEDDVTNRMVDSINLFSQIVNSPWFIDKPVLLFLNKRDLFEEKVKRTKISSISHFRDAGPIDSYEAGVDYFTKKFMNVVGNGNGEDGGESKTMNGSGGNSGNNDGGMGDFFCKPTCATDSDNIEFVMQSVKEFVLYGNMEDADMF